MIGQMVPTALVTADGAHTTTTIKAVVEEAGGRSSSPPPTPYHTAPEESSPSPVGSGDRMDLSPDPLERPNSNNNNNSKETDRTSDLSTTSSSCQLGARAKRVSTIRKVNISHY